MPSTARAETGFVAALTVVGAVLRFWGPGHLGLNHFDEGIYALASMWSSSPKGLASITPELIAYAPPLYPILVGVAYLFLGVSDVTAILVSQIAGTLTIPAVAWVARRTFGPGTGAAAAVLVALSGPHIAFSRMALTDATFLLCWVLALGLGGRFLERPGLWRAIVLGLMVGLAQNAKYNGYLAGGIVAIAAVWGLIRKSGDGVRGMGYGALAAIIAVVVYIPWYRFVESHPGGYAGLMKHHRSYLSGPSAWPFHWRLQMAQSYALSGELIEGLTWGILAWPILWIVGTTTSGQDRTTRRSQVRVRMGFVIGTAVYGVAPNFGWWVALAMMPWWVCSGSATQRVLGIGWLVMAVMTPFYHPYARLWLPLHAFGWIALAGLVREKARSSRWAGRLLAASLAVAIVAAVVSDAGIEPRARSLGSPLGPTDGLRIEVAKLAVRIKGGTPGQPVANRIILYARPSVLFYLASQVDRPILRMADPAMFVREARDRDIGVLDYNGMTGFDASVPMTFWDLINRGHNTGRSASFVFVEPAATWADLRPSAVFDRLITNDDALQYVPIRVP